MKTKLIVTISLYLLIVNPHIFGQSTIVHPKFNQTVVLTPGKHIYTDDGGANGNYSANVSSTLILRPSPGYFIYYSFRDFETEKIGNNCFDYLNINPYIFHCNFYNNPGEDYCGDYSDVLRIGTGAAVCDGRDIMSTFFSDGGVQKKGWIIDIEVMPKNLKQNFCSVESYCSFPGFPYDQVYCDQEFSVVVNNFSGSSCGGLIDIYEGCGTHTGGYESVVEFLNPKAQDVHFHFEGSDLMDVFIVSGCTCQGTSKAKNGIIDFTMKSLKAGLYKIVFEYRRGADLAFISGLINCGEINDGNLDCNSAIPIDCGQTLTGNTYNSKNKVATYPTCQNTIDMTGNEMIYSFVPTVNGEVTIDLTGLVSNLDMFLLESCDITGGCIKKSRLTGVSNEQIKFYASSNIDYYIVIDGNNKANSPFQLSVSCSSTECQTCGSCFTYGLYSTATDRSKIKLYSKYSKCSDPNYPIGYDIEWYRQNQLITKGPNAEYVLGNNLPVNICQKVLKGSVIEFECCKMITPQPYNLQGPIAHFDVSNLNTTSIICDASQTANASSISMDFGDGGAGTVTKTGSIFEQKYKNNGPFIVCLEATNLYGMSRYCQEIHFGGIECGGPVQYPKFDYSIDNNGMIVLSASNTSNIESYDISFGDGNHVTGTTWLGTISYQYPLMDVFEVQIQYTQKRVVGGFTCKNDGCMNFTVKTKAIIATNDLKNSDVMIYPNPTNDYLYINSKNIVINISNIKLYNSQGQEITLHFSEQDKKINTKSLFSGVYYLQIQYNDKSEFYRFLKI